MVDRRRYLSGYRRPLGLVALVALVQLSAAGCGRDAAAPSAASVASTATRLAVAAGADLPWFEGSVEEAFALAKVERKPLFLYWGAVWCPPCHALRTKLFTRPEIRERLASTVAVYLDGDSERAQIWGEKLGTSGYPTVIVFDADGRELTRIPNTLTFEQYGEVLSRALAATRPISELVATARKQGPAALDAAESNLLAFYSFRQDPTLDLDNAAERELFGRLWRETPTDRALERSRFLGLYAIALAGEGEPTPSAAERAAVRSALEALLGDPVTRASNLELILYSAGDVVQALIPEPGAERNAFAAAWIAAARALESDATLTTDDRLSALAPQIELAVLAASRPKAGESVVLPPELRERVRDRIRWASGEVRGEDELQAVMSTMAGLLEDAGLVDEARALLAKRAGETLSPYYYTSWLAGLEARAGRPEEAVRLYREAWQGARAAAAGGSAMTPLRWGSTYLRQATKLTPNAGDAIAADAATLVDDLLASPDAFAHGNWSRIESLATALEAWRAADASRAALVASLAARVHAACDRYPAAGEDSAAERCRSFLAPAA